MQSSAKPIGRFTCLQCLRQSLHVAPQQSRLSRIRAYSSGASPPTPSTSTSTFAGRYLQGGQFQRALQQPQRWQQRTHGPSIPSPPAGGRMRPGRRNRARPLTTILLAAKHKQQQRQRRRRGGDGHSQNAHLDRAILTGDRTLVRPTGGRLRLSATRRARTIRIPIVGKTAAAETRVSQQQRNSGTEGSIGKDDLQPASESGFAIEGDQQQASMTTTTTTSSIPKLSERTKDDVIAEMNRIMQPLIDRCRTQLGDENSSELKKLHEYLRQQIAVYLSIKKEKKLYRHQESFLREIADSKWNEDREATLRESEILLGRSLEEAQPSGSAVAENTQSDLEASGLPSISARSVKITKVEPERQAAVATLAHGLERVLFNPGIHWLQEPKSGYYNYPKDIQQVMSKDEFDFDQLPQFVPPSKDPDLRILLHKHGKRFAGSTSSLTSVMSHIYFALNGRKDLNTQTPSFVNEPRSFTTSTQLPASVVLNRTAEGAYLVDADKSVDLNASSNVLSLLGNVLEKLLTYPTKDFQRFSKTSINPFKPEESRDKREAYHYSATDSMLMRSQLDCHDPRLPKQTFDIKTRATIAIRRDILNHAHSAGYTITKALGYLESFEREKYDLVRSAFLKYSFQARIGDMDGIFLAYHSTERIFGFEYLPLAELDSCISGSHEESTQAYHLCVGLLEAILKRVTADLPDQSVKLTVDSSKGSLSVLASPLGDDDTVTPLKLYDVQLTSYLNGKEVPSSMDVDFRTHPIGDESKLEWSVSYDIAVNEDETFNRRRLKRVRHRQARFTKQVMLPEGLSQEEIDRALKGVTANAELGGEAVLADGARGRVKSGAAPDSSDTSPTEPNSNTEGSSTKEESKTRIVSGFKPTPGVQYTVKAYGLVPRLRELARQGRQRAARLLSGDQSKKAKQAHRQKQ